MDSSLIRFIAYDHYHSTSTSPSAVTLIDQAPWLYPTLLWAHRLLVGLSLCLFALRGLGALWQQDWIMRRGVRSASVAIDSLLLTAGISLWVLLRHNPLYESWLSTKLALLLPYMVLGSFALKRARSRGARLVFLLAALLCAAAMVTIARTRDPLGWWPW